MKANQLREKSPKELQEELVATLKEKFNLRMQQAMGQTPNPKLKQQAKLKLARIKTIMTEKGA